MPKYGRAVVLAEVGAPLEIREYPVPDLEPGAALVRLTLSNVCGSDLHIWRGELDPRKRNWALPRHQGHEMTGYIEKLGEGVTSDSDGQPLKEGRPRRLPVLLPLRTLQELPGRPQPRLPPAVRPHRRPLRPAAVLQRRLGRLLLPPPAPHRLQGAGPPLG